MPHRATEGFVTRIDGRVYRYGRGDDVPDDHADRLEGLTEPYEQATAAPGELRTLSYECDDCDFTTHSPVGLKIHRTQKHDG